MKSAAKKLARRLAISKKLLLRAAVYEFSLLEPTFQIDIVQRFLSVHKDVSLPVLPIPALLTLTEEVS
jgi:hypothetical protein